MFICNQDVLFPALIAKGVGSLIIWVHSLALSFNIYYKNNHNLKLPEIFLQNNWSLVAWVGPKKLVLYQVVPSTLQPPSCSI